MILQRDIFDQSRITVIDEFSGNEVGIIIRDTLRIYGRGTTIHESQGAAISAARDYLINNPQPVGRPTLQQKQNNQINLF